jgi:pachytene checkpoint protein 2
MEEKADGSKGTLGGDYVVVNKHDDSSKHGVLFVEARIRDDLMSDPHQQIMVSKVKETLCLIRTGLLQF